MKKIGAGEIYLGTLVGGRPGSTIFQNSGGVGGGGLGGFAYKDPAWPPPRVCIPLAPFFGGGC